jgi:5'-nucleotidase
LGAACGGGAASPTPTAVPAASAAVPAPSPQRPALASPLPSPSAAAATTSGATPTAVADAGGGDTREVQSGDTLLTIAEQAYGDATQWRKIYDANKDVIGSDPDKLKIGMKLKIPPKQ